RLARGISRLRGWGPSSSGAASENGCDDDDDDHKNAHVYPRDEVGPFSSFGARREAEPGSGRSGGELFREAPRRNGAQARLLLGHEAFILARASRCASDERQNRGSL